LLASRRFHTCSGVHEPAHPVLRCPVYWCTDFVVDGPLPNRIDEGTVAYDAIPQDPFPNRLFRGSHSDGSLCN
jgi:hypothetical protein